MPESINVGRGAEGLTPGGQMSEDVLSILDRTRRPAVEANAQQNLQILQGKREGEMQSLNDQAADAILQQARMKQLKDLDPKADPEGYMKALAEQIRKMESEAKNVDVMGTHNVAAKNTFIQVSNILKKRLAAMQSEMAGLTAHQEAPESQDIRPAPMPIQNAAGGQ